MYVSKVASYATESDEARGNFSVGIAVASRLNGNGLLTGSFNESGGKARRIGHITALEKFETREEANAYIKDELKGLKRGMKLSPTEWAWGDIDEEAMLSNPESKAAIHDVNYIGAMSDDGVVEEETPSPVAKKAAAAIAKKVAVEDKRAAAKEAKRIAAEAKIAAAIATQRIQH